MKLSKRIVGIVVYLIVLAISAFGAIVTTADLVNNNASYSDNIAAIQFFMFSLALYGSAITSMVGLAKIIRGKADFYCIRPMLLGLAFICFGALGWTIQKSGSIHFTGSRSEFDFYTIYVILGLCGISFIISTLFNFYWKKSLNALFSFIGFLSLISLTIVNCDYARAVKDTIKTEFFVLAFLIVLLTILAFAFYLFCFVDCAVAQALKNKENLNSRYTVIDPAKKIQEARELYERRAITQEEFEAAKNKYLKKL